MSAKTIMQTKEMSTTQQKSVGFWRDGRECDWRGYRRNFGVMPVFCVTTYTVSRQVSMQIFIILYICVLFFFFLSMGYIS